MSLTVTATRGAAIWFAGLMMAVLATRFRISSRTFTWRRVDRGSDCADCMGRHFVGAPSVHGHAVVIRHVQVVPGGLLVFGVAILIGSA